jgi:hypothetical protein
MRFWLTAGFFDTSTLTKRHVEEEGPEQVRAHCTTADARDAGR